MMWTTEDYTLIAWLFPRLLGFIYFFAMGALYFQIKGLLGKNGILPISRYLELGRLHYSPHCYWMIPSIFWIDAGDRMLIATVMMGLALSIGLILGIYPPLMILLLYVLYLSIVSTGQDFLGFGWEGFLLEVTAHAFFLSLTVIPNLFVFLSVNFLLFRFHFQAGAVKLQSQDRSWRNLTAIAYHYETQPLPNTIAWYIHKFPLWFHQLSTCMMFIVELLIPFAIFGSHTLRAAVFIPFFGLQYFIWLTGNFSYLNYLTVVLCTILLSNSFLIPLGFQSLHYQGGTHWISDLFLSLCGGLLLALQIIRFIHHFFPIQLFGRILDKVAPFHLANRYGIFAIMTTKRYEVMIEGSHDGLEWKEYAFKYKPSEINRRPRRISPYQPRIDWQAWFLPFTSFYSEAWFQNFLFHLLKGSPEVLSLLRVNPFPEDPPKYMRVLLYEYKFTSFREKKETGCWWKRTLVGQYSPIVSLKNR